MELIIFVDLKCTLCYSLCRNGGKFMNILSKRIKERREVLGLSQDDLAKKMGYKSRSTIAKIESGENDIPQSKIKAFADALNTTPSYLLGWKKDEDMIISKEFQMTKEAIDTISEFSLVINKNTGSSMMDIFNKMVSNPLFESIVKHILMYTARTEQDWGQMQSSLTDGQDIPVIDKKLVKSLCYNEIIKEFEKLLDEVLNSELETFNKITKDKDGNLKIEINEDKKYLYYHKDK